MVSNRKKGQSIELKGFKLLKGQGWYLEARAPPTTKFNKGVDLCEGLFDAILHKNQYGLKKRLYVQFKTQNKPNLKPFEEFCLNECDDRDYVQIWVWKRRKGFKVWQLHYDFQDIQTKVLNGVSGV